MAAGMIALNASAATLQQLDYAQVHGLAWLLKNQKGDGNWTSAPGMDMIATTSAIEALHRAGILGFPYTRAISWLGNPTIRG